MSKPRKFKTKEAHRAWAAEQMKINRAAHPEKFAGGKNKKNDGLNPYKRQKLRAEKAEQALAELKKNQPVAAPAPEKTVPAVTTPEILPAKPVESKLPDPPAPETPTIQTVDQEDLFSATPPLDAPIDDKNAPPPAPDAPPPQSGQEQPKQTSSAGVNRALAVTVWGMLVQIFIKVFGNGMIPVVFETPAGKIDENENIVIGWCEWFDSLGMTKLSPLWNLILLISGYFLVRLNYLIDWFKARKERSAQRRAEARDKSVQKDKEEQSSPEQKIVPMRPPPPPREAVTRETPLKPVQFSEAGQGDESDFS